MLKRAIDAVNHADWTARVCDGFAAFYLWPCTDASQHILLHRCMGALVQRAADSVFIQRRVALMFDSAALSDPLDRHALAMGLGTVAAVHLDVVLATLEQVLDSYSVSNLQRIYQFVKTLGNQSAIFIPKTSSASSASKLALPPLERLFKKETATSAAADFLRDPLMHDDVCAALALTYRYTVAFSEASVVDSRIRTLLDANVLAQLAAMTSFPAKLAVDANVFAPLAAVAALPAKAAVVQSILTLASAALTAPPSALTTPPPPHSTVRKSVQVSKHSVVQVRSRHLAVRGGGAYVLGEEEVRLQMACVQACTALIRSHPQLTSAVRKSVQAVTPLLCIDDSPLAGRVKGERGLGRGRGEGGIGTVDVEGGGGGEGREEREGSSTSSSDSESGSDEDEEKVRRNEKEEKRRVRRTGGRERRGQRKQLGPLAVSVISLLCSVLQMSNVDSKEEEEQLQIMLSLLRPLLSLLLPPSPPPQPSSHLPSALNPTTLLSSAFPSNTTPPSSTHPNPAAPLQTQAGSKPGSKPSSKPTSKPSSQPGSPGPRARGKSNLGGAAGGGERGGGEEGEGGAGERERETGEAEAASAVEVVASAQQRVLTAYLAVCAQFHLLALGDEGLLGCCKEQVCGFLEASSGGVRYTEMQQAHTPPSRPSLNLGHHVAVVLPFCANVFCTSVNLSFCQSVILPLHQSANFAILPPPIPSSHQVVLLLLTTAVALSSPPEASCVSPDNPPEVSSQSAHSPPASPSSSLPVSTHPATHQLDETTETSSQQEAQPAAAAAGPRASSESPSSHPSSQPTHSSLLAALEAKVSAVSHQVGKLIVGMGWAVLRGSSQGEMVEGSSEEQRAVLFAAAVECVAHVLTADEVAGSAPPSSRRVPSHLLRQPLPLATHQFTSLPFIIPSPCHQVAVLLLAADAFLHITCAGHSPSTTTSTNQGSQAHEDRDRGSVHLQGAAAAECEYVGSVVSRCMEAVLRIISLRGHQVQQQGESEAEEGSSSAVQPLLRVLDHFFPCRPSLSLLEITQHPSLSPQLFHQLVPKLTPGFDPVGASSYSPTICSPSFAVPPFRPRFLQEIARHPSLGPQLFHLLLPKLIPGFDPVGLVEGLHQAAQPQSLEQHGSEQLAAPEGAGAAAAGVLTEGQQDESAASEAAEQAQLGKAVSEAAAAAGGGGAGGGAAAAASLTFDPSATVAAAVVAAASHAGRARRVGSVGSAGKPFIYSSGSKAANRTLGIMLRHPSPNLKQAALPYTIPTVHTLHLLLCALAIDTIASHPEAALSSTGPLSKRINDAITAADGGLWSSDPFLLVYGALRSVAQFFNHHPLIEEGDTSENGRGDTSENGRGGIDMTVGQLSVLCGLVAALVGAMLSAGEPQGDELLPVETFLTQAVECTSVYKYITDAALMCHAMSLRWRTDGSDLEATIAWQLERFQEASSAARAVILLILSKLPQSSSPPPPVAHRILSTASLSLQDPSAMVSLAAAICTHQCLSQCSFLANQALPAATILQSTRAIMRVRAPQAQAAAAWMAGAVASSLLKQQQLQHAPSSGDECSEQPPPSTAECSRAELQDIKPEVRETMTTLWFLSEHQPDLVTSACKASSHSLAWLLRSDQGDESTHQPLMESGLFTGSFYQFLSNDFVTSFDAYTGFTLEALSHPSDSVKLTAISFFTGLIQFVAETRSAAQAGRSTTPASSTPVACGPSNAFSSSPLPQSGVAFAIPVPLTKALSQLLKKSPNEKLRAAAASSLGEILRLSFKRERLG
ncbi:unnamed protein product [Closterium sp. NIES-65]|nr:unnamed protein product [Closterium sp. NIES-65]